MQVQQLLSTNYVIEIIFREYFSHYIVKLLICFIHNVIFL